MSTRSKDFNRLRSVSGSILRSQTPVRTGNLKRTIKTSQTAPNQFTITIGGPKAPYVLFVNEKWVHPRWNGRQNPREGFINRAAELMAVNIETNMKVRRK